MLVREQVRAFLEMFESLQKSVDEAGGSGYTVEQLSNITVLDLIQRLATNNVRFIYTGPKRAEEEDEPAA